MINQKGTGLVVLALSAVLASGNPFADVAENSWQYPYVKYAYDQGFMGGNGTDAEGKVIFKPDEDISREQFVQILYSKEGKPTIEYANRFSDVSDGKWYTGAILWATENNIVAGVDGGTRFGVNQSITREEMATMLRAYAEYKSWDTTKRAEFEGFADADNISSWAVENMQWAIAEGVMAGKGVYLAPKESATRAEAATMLKALIEAYEQPLTKAMWIWHVEDVIDTAKREELLAFALEKGLNTLYIEAGSVEDHVEAFRAFNRQAHELGMTVEALDGNSEWVRAENHVIALGKIRDIIDFNNSVTDPLERFDGIHHDNEPYTLGDWSENAEALAADYLVLAAASQSLAEANGLTYAVDIPMWYESNELTVAIAYEGETKPLSHHIIDIVDYAAIMAYRDFAEGADGIIYHSEDEVTYAASINKKVVVGVETMGFDADDTDNPEKITFYEEGELYMNQELEKVIDYYTEGLKGMAIHYYLTYKDLCK